MNFTMPVNEYLKDEITKITQAMVPPRFHGDTHSLRMVQNSLARVIDTLGEESSKEQGLKKIITTAQKLQNSPTVNMLYLLKDASARGGQGEVIGMLRVGRKHLYLYDQSAKVREVEPLCVLDFYVKSGRQRRGYGKRLFDYMLQEEGVHPEALAIDGPSPKMISFLNKSYGIIHLIKQSNNFSITANFFSSDDISLSGRCTPVATTQTVGRFAAHKPHSSISSVIHGVGEGASNNSLTSRRRRFAANKPRSSLSLVIHGVSNQRYDNHNVDAHN